jgi:hypothetical protein
MDESAAVPSADTSLVDAAACIRLLHATGAEEADVKRHELLFELALVFGGSPALTLLRILTPDEEERLADEINQARTRLEPWATTTYVRRLDETLRSCGLTAGFASAVMRAEVPSPRRT